MNFESLDEVLEEHGLMGAVVVGSDGEVMAKRGKLRHSSTADLLSALIGPQGDAKTTFESLHGQPLPRIFSQGDDFAFVHLPISNVMVVTRGKGDNDAVFLYEKSKAVDAAITSVLGRASGEKS